MKPSFRDDFAGLFDRHFSRVYRYLNRLSGEPELAADIAQDTFIRLYQRGYAPDKPEAWLITVATNLFRNARTKQTRRARLLTLRVEDVLPDPPRSPADAADRREPRRRVRTALDGVPERERQMLLLLAEGYSYRDIAAATGVHEASVGTMLARAKRAFRNLYQDDPDAPR